MVNHFRTLLVNQAAGTDAVYIEPSFFPQVIPVELRPLYEAFIPLGLTAQARSAAVFAALQLAHAPDFEWLTLAFDSRYTYAVNDAAYLALAANGTLPTRPSFDKLYQSVVVAAVQAELTGALFRPVAGYETQVTTLRTRYNAGGSRTAQLTAGLLALGYQLHRNYIGNTNG